jgi:lauroyl/myristoyl acyltransferase
MSRGAPVIERNLPPVTPKKSDQSTQALVRKSMETKSKMADINQNGD